MDRIPLVTNSLEYIEPSKLYPSLILSQLCKTSDCSNIPYTCYEVGHTWHPNCLHSALQLFVGSSKQSIQIYGLLYLVTAILRRRPLKYFLTKLPHEILRSTFFLASNCFLFLQFFCLHRKFFGRISYGGILLFNLPACFLSILLERKQRRGLLALYLANLATETGFNMMVDRKWIQTIPNGEVLLFSVVSAVYIYLFRTRALDGSLFNIIKTFLGPAEVNDPKTPKDGYRKSRIVKYYGFVTEIINNFINLFKKNKNEKSKMDNRFYELMKSFEYKMDLFLDRMSIAQGKKHRLCSHRYSCILYSVVGFIQRFIAGFLLQAGVKVASSVVAIIKNPKNLIRILSSRTNIELGLFLGFYNLIFRAANCLLRWVTNKNNKFHSIISGFLAGWSMVFYKSSSISLYLMFKLFEILWMLGVRSNALPLYKNFDVILYSVATSFVLWIAVFEPHNIRQQYWKFLLRASSNRFGQVNRQLLDVFGTHASRVNSTMRPLYNPAISALNSHLLN